MLITAPKRDEDRQAACILGEMAIRALMTRLVWKLAYVGISDSDDDATRTQKAALTLAAAIIGAGVPFSWSAGGRSRPDAGSH